MWRVNRNLREYLNIHFLLWKVITKTEKLRRSYARHFVLSMKQMPQASSREMTVATVKERNRGWGGEGGGAKEGAEPGRGQGGQKEVGPRTADFL